MIKTAPVQPMEARRGTVYPFPLRIPWHFHERAWSVYAAAGHNDQSAEKVAQRGGFGVEELVACLALGSYKATHQVTAEHVEAVRNEIEAWASGTAELEARICAVEAELAEAREGWSVATQAEVSLRARVADLSAQVTAAFDERDALASTVETLRVEQEVAERGHTSMAKLDAVLREYPDADTSCLWVPADEALALDQRRDVQAKSRRAWIDAIVGCPESANPDEARVYVEGLVAKVARAEAAEATVAEVVTMAVDANLGIPQSPAEAIERIRAALAERAEGRATVARLSAVLGVLREAASVVTQWIATGNPRLTADIQALSAALSFDPTTTDAIRQIEARAIEEAAARVEQYGYGYCAVIAKALREMAQKRQGCGT